MARDIELDRQAVRGWIDRIFDANEQTLFSEVRDEVVWTLDHLLDRITDLEEAVRATRESTTRGNPS